MLAAALASKGRCFPFEGLVVQASFSHLGAFLMVVGAWELWVAVFLWEMEYIPWEQVSLAS